MAEEEASRGLAGEMLMYLSRSMGWVDGAAEGVWEAKDEDLARLTTVLTWVCERWPGSCDDDERWGYSRIAVHGTQGAVCRRGCERVRGIHADIRHVLPTWRRYLRVQTFILIPDLHMALRESPGRFQTCVELT